MRPEGREWREGGGGTTVALARGRFPYLSVVVAGGRQCSGRIGRVSGAVFAAAVDAAAAAAVRRQRCVAVVAALGNVLAASVAAGTVGRGHVRLRLQPAAFRAAIVVVVVVVLPQFRCQGAGRRR